MFEAHEPGTCPVEDGTALGERRHGFHAGTLEGDAATNFDRGAQTKRVARGHPPFVDEREGGTPGETTEPAVGIEPSKAFGSTEAGSARVVGYDERYEVCVVDAFETVLRDSIGKRRIGHGDDELQSTCLDGAEASPRYAEVILTRNSLASVAGTLSICPRPPLGSSASPA